MERSFPRHSHRRSLDIQKATLEVFTQAAYRAAFLKQEELQDGTELGLMAVRATHGERPVYVIGGRRLDKDFLSALDLPAGMRALSLPESQRSFLARLADRSFRISHRRKHSLNKLQLVVDAVWKYGQEMNAGSGMVGRSRGR